MDEKERDARRKAQKRAQDRDLRISRPFDLERRTRCLADIYEFLPTYFPTIFYQPFTPDRREMIDAIMHAARFGGDQAVAGPRADGKTRSALFCALALCLAGHVSFPMIISKSGPRASRELTNLKDAIASPNNLAFVQDFPEIAEPIIALGRWSSRARQQTVGGQYTNLEWGQECVIFPTITTELLRSQGWLPTDPESAARGQIIASLGIEGPIRGYSVRNLRPDVAILDDLDDRESAKSETQTENRENIVEQDVGGLAGPDKTVSRVMLCTLINQTCIAATFTDRSKKPSWRGQRHRLLLKNPDRMDLWEEYISLRCNRAQDDPDARQAHQFYLDHRAEMDEGAVVTNPYRYDSRPLLDGQPAEASALQACFNIIADRGQVHFDTEYQNDPPAETGPVESGITRARVQKQLNGHPRFLIPNGTAFVTAGIDVGKWRLHYVVRAWMQDGTGHTIDYGVHTIYGATRGTDDGLDVAIHRGVCELAQMLRNGEYRRTDGELRPIDLMLVDAGYRSQAVYTACGSLGLGIAPVMGFGKSAGCAQANFSDVQHRTKDRKPGDGWFQTKKGNVWLVCADADRWKAWEHDRWMTAADMPGSLHLWGEGATDSDRGGFSADEKDHRQYADQICGEVEVEELVKGVLKRYWKARGDNHYLDASYYANVAAAMKGVRVTNAPRAHRPAPKRVVSAGNKKANFLERPGGWIPKHAS